MTAARAAANYYLRSERIAIATCLMALLGAGCASAPSAGTSAAKDTAAGSAASSVDIAYVLGHNQRRFHAEDGTTGTRAQAFLDRQVIDQGAIDREHYTGFLQKAASFIDAQKGAPDPHPACRDPFTVTVKIGEDTKVSRGCRSSDEAGISHLVRDGEFLLSSKKN